MTFKKAYKKIKRFLLWVLVYFLPRPGSAPEGDEVVTEDGIREITIKLFSFLGISAFLGFGLNIVISSGFIDPILGLEAKSYPAKLTSNGAPVSSLSFMEYSLVTVSVIYSIMMPFLRYIYSWLKVTGILYAVAVGFIISYSIIVQEVNQTRMDFLAILLAGIFSLVPSYLLKYKNIKLPKHFSTLTYVSFVIVTFGGSFASILNQIPLLADFSENLIRLSEYNDIRIITAALKAIISFFFLFIAYDRMEDYVKRGVSKKYEWLVTFTGFYTSCIIVLKLSEMLELLS